jgi:hypothetical protein
MISLPKMASFRLSPSKIREFMQLIQERATTNPLYSLADTAQAITAIQSMSILNSLYDTLSDEGMSGDMDDINKLVTLIVKANTSVNSTFKQLSISSDNREEEVDTDPLSRMLRELNLDDYTPPMLKAHFIKAKKDIKAIETGEITGDTQTLEEKQQMLDDIKKPIKSWVETPTDSEKEEVVDIEAEGAKGL